MYMLLYRGMSVESLERHESPHSSLASPSHNSPKQIATVLPKGAKKLSSEESNDESPTALIKGRRESNCSNRKTKQKFELECYQLTCCLQR